MVDNVMGRDAMHRVSTLRNYVAQMCCPPFFMKNLINSFDRQFAILHENSVSLVREIPLEKIYWQPFESGALFPVNSCGEYILRSAGAVEQTFGGITVRLWDDPFEWTLPEKLSTNELILEYLQEVEETRRKGFAFFQTDEDLKREMPAPEKLKSIVQILLETLARAENFQGRALAIFKIIKSGKTRFE